jgi:UDP-N-acetylglucosamine 2-epimerase
MHVLHVVGARPNFMKVAPVHAAFRKRAGVRQSLVHTGQHYDANLSDIFFEQLQIPRPDVSLEVGSGSHAVQTAEVMIRFEKTILERKPDLVLVYGDVNSTVAATLVCAKLGTKIAHVEAGLRSFDRTMPEEINRLVTDQLADLLLIPSDEAVGNLLREGVAREKIHFVGNVMIDTLRTLLPQARMPEIAGLTDQFALVTLHRPSNVDERGGSKAWATISRTRNEFSPFHRQDTWSVWHSNSERRWSLRIRVGFKKRRPRWGSPVSQCEKTPKDPSRLLTARTRWSARIWTYCCKKSRRSWPDKVREDGFLPCGTAWLRNVSPTWS